MCGICGVCGLDDRNLIKKMAEVIKHRGPDDEGFYIDKDIMLGHKRLSIIDIKTGHQPIFNEDKSIVIVYNGEVYNFKELRQELEKNGHRFYTNTDTEVIVHAYEEYGDNCPSYFNGMFAFAIWDSNKKKLLISRDRLGIKPVYYTKIRDIFLFASEIKSILQYNDVKREIDYGALDEYLTFRHSLAPKTLFKNIFKLLPGHNLVYEDGSISIESYWDIKKIELYGNTEEFYIKTFRNQLEESVKKRLISDVPLGVYISGGVDSASIVALMSKMGVKEIETFCIGTDDYNDPNNELPKAKTIADHFGTNHHEIIINEEVINVMPRVVWHLDEPLGEATMTMMYHLSKKSKEFVTVALTGEGADEILGGYVQYKHLLLGNNMGRFIPLPIAKQVLPKIIDIIPLGVLDKMFDYPSSLGEEGKKRVREYVGSLKDETESYLATVSLFSEKDKDELYYGGIKENIDKGIKSKTQEIFFNNKDSFYDKIFYREIKTWLPDLILNRQDKIAMANAIEARVPYLDYQLVELSASIPLKLKIRWMDDKYILRRCMRDILPKEFSKRKKFPFFIPVDKWFEKNIRDIALKILSESELSKHGCFKHRYIQKIIENHNKSKLIFSRQLWALLAFQLWHTIYIERDKIKEEKLNLNDFY